jgi:CheY-like chemotaxis protein
MSSHDDPLASPGERELIIVVEDNRDINDLLSSILEEEGYRVISVTDGRQAQDAARLHRPDLITLDLAMPGKDGWAVARELQDDPATADIPVVVISAYARDLESPLRRQIAHLIAKPFYVSQVVTEVQAILRRRAQAGVQDFTTERTEHTKSS